ncbi:MAG TPA: T9SS type A sorting domain-containing protein, partial [Ignavibacteriaceae bacterium]|nr:T9SS type A sorting domain-containing protein [Ignavibacteriaceae bacterium]
YSLQESSNVELKIYNILGEEVALLVKEYQHTGKYKVNFNARSLPSGVYIYMLQAGEYFSSKKMIYSK